LDQRHCATILLDERDVRSPAADRFDAHCACAGISVEHARALDAGRQDVEECFAQLVRRRAKAVPVGGLQAAALEASSNESHAWEVCLWGLAFGGRGWGVGSRLSPRR